MKKKLVFIFIMLFYICFINVGFAQNIENIKYDDFLLDKNLLIGKTIIIKGFCRNPYSDKYYLYKSEKFEDSSRVISLVTTNLSNETKEWLSQNCKKGIFVTLKAIVEDYEINVLEIEEANNEQTSTNDYKPKKVRGLVDFDNFILDRDSFIGKIIIINGYCRNNYNDKYYLFKSDQFEDRSKAIRLSTSDLSREERKWLLQNCKNGVFINIKAVVDKYDLKVLKIEEADNEPLKIDEDCLNYYDFTSDKDSYIGKTITIKGFCRNLYDDKYYLYNSNKFEDRLNSISLSVENLPREERKWLLENCKLGRFLIIKAIVEKYDLKVIKIEEAIF